MFTTKLELIPKAQQVALNYHSVSDPSRAQDSADTFAASSSMVNSCSLPIDSGKQTRVLAELLCDPKGSVAKWMVNMVQKDWPHSTIQRLRRQVAKPDVTDNPKLSDAMKQARILAR